MTRFRTFHAIERFIACERGNMLVEFGLAASLLATVTLGLFEYAAVTNQSIKISNAARAAVEYAKHSPSDAAGIAAAAVNSGSLNAETLTVAVDQFCECPDTGTVECTAECDDGSTNNSYVTVTLSQPAESFMEEGGLMSGKTLTGSATLRTR